MPETSEYGARIALSQIYSDLFYESLPLDKSYEEIATLIIGKIDIMREGEIEWDESY